MPKNAFVTCLAILSALLSFAAQAQDSDEATEAAGVLIGAYTWTRVVPVITNECSKRYPELAIKWQKTNRAYRGYFDDTYTLIQKQYAISMALAAPSNEIEQALGQLQLRAFEKAGTEWEKVCGWENDENNLSRLIKLYDLSRAHPRINNFHKAIEKGWLSQLASYYKNMSPRDRQKEGREIVEGLRKAAQQ